MKLTDILPGDGQIKLIQGIEERLRRRKRTENVSLTIAVALAILQIIMAKLSGRSFDSIIQSVFNFFHFIVLSASNYGKAIERYPSPDWELTGFFIVVLSFAFYLLLKRTQFLFRYSEEPFRYTFWIEPFRHVRDTEKENYKIGSEDRFHHLIHHDLMERLNERIKRLSLLNTDHLDEAARRNLSSHIHISGAFTIREERKGECIVQVMPRVRVGAPDRPETLAKSIKYKLKDCDTLCEPDRFDELFDADQYKQLIERIYSGISTEIYRRIKMDLDEKVALFPTKALKAIALYHEAEDFARSNTLDAYDHAIELYRASRRFFDITLAAPFKRMLLRFPLLLWRSSVSFQYRVSRVELGYAKCLIYRRQISALSGRPQNPLFEIPERLKSVIRNLSVLTYRFEKYKTRGMSTDTGVCDTERNIRKEAQRHNRMMAFLTFKPDSWSKHFTLYPWQWRFDKQRRLLFDAYLISAITYYYLEATRRAKSFLEDAKAIAPDLIENNALYFFASGVIEPNLNKKIQNFRRAIEIAPDFQIAQYLLAKFVEKRFRRHNEISWQRAKKVFQEYENVLKINPGNIASIAAMGYLYWLVGQNKRAWETFQSGHEIKATSQQTFVGELSYGLARLAVEAEDFNECIYYLDEAFSADPGTGAYSVTAGKFAITTFYESIDTMVLNRYTEYLEQFEATFNQAKTKQDGHMVFSRSALQADGAKIPENDEAEFSSRTMNKIYSFVLNDCANACANYFLQFGDESRLNKAIAFYEEALVRDEENAIVYYNLSVVSRWRGRTTDIKRADKCLEEAIGRMSTWPPIFSLIIESSRELKMGLRRELEKYPVIASPVAEKAAEGIDEEPSKAPVVFDTEKATQAFYQSAVIAKKLEKIAGMVTEFIRETQLAPLFFEREIEKIIDFEALRPGRLNENDVYALMLLAEMWSNKIRDNRARSAAIGLCNYLSEKFFPERFDTSMTIRDIFSIIHEEHRMAAKRTGGELEAVEQDDCKVQIKAANNVIKATIVKWMAEEPSGYAGLTWVSDEYGYEQVEVVNHLSSAVERDPANPAVYNLLANASAAYKDREAAIAYYERAIALAPGEARYYINLGGYYQDLGHWDQAEANYQKALESDPDNSDCWNYLANILYQKRSYKMSLEHYQKAIGIAPGIPVYHGNMGRACRAMGKWDDAISAFQEALRIDDDNDSFWNELGNICYSCGRYAESIEHYQAAIRLSSNVPVYHANLAGSYRAMKQWREAVEAYRAALAIEEDNDSYWNSIGNVYFESGDHASSIPYYEAAIKREPHTAVYYKNIASAWEGNKETGRRIAAIGWAIHHMRKACELEPDSDDYKRQLETLLLKQRVATELGESVLDKQMIVTPIAIEMSSDLIPLVEGEGDGLLPALSSLIKRMRERLAERFGVRVPGVRFRGNETDLPPGTYIIMLDEIPVASGNIGIERRLYMGPVETLDEKGISGETFMIPFLEERGVWIEQRDCEKIETDELHLWEVFEYPMRHLEAILQKNLADYVGHQEVANMLGQSDSGAAELIFREKGRLTAYTLVLRALVSDEVTIKPFDSILAAFTDAHQNGVPLLEIVERLRLLPEVYETLPGRGKNYQWLRLGYDFETAIEKSIYTRGSCPVLALAPKLCQQMLAVVRAKAEEVDHFALITGSERTRHFVRRLIALEFPNIPVLSAKEADRDDEDRTVEELRLDFEEVIETPAGAADDSVGGDYGTGLGKVDDRQAVSKEAGWPKITVLLSDVMISSPLNLDDKPVEEMLGMMRDGLFYELGIILPEVKLAPDTQLDPAIFQIEIDGMELGPFQGLQQDRFLVNGTVDRVKLLGLKGREAVNPANGSPCAIVRNKDGARDRCIEAGLTTWGPAGYIILCLSVEIRRRAAMFLTRSTVQYNLAMLDAAFPDLVRTAEARFGSERLTHILKTLLEEEITIRDLRTILEGLLSINGVSDVDVNRYIVFSAGPGMLCFSQRSRSLEAMDTNEYSDCVRVSLKRYITHKYSRGNNTMIVYLVDPELEQRLREIEERELSETERGKIIKSVSDELGDSDPFGPHPAILTTIDVRRRFRESLGNDFPYLVVLCYQELSPDVNIQPIARISLT